MKIFKRLLQITRITLLSILAVYAGAALVLIGLSDPPFKSGSGPTVPPETPERFRSAASMSPDDYRVALRAVAKSWLAGNGFSDARLSVR